MMPYDDIQKYFASDSNYFLHLDNPKWLKHLNKKVGKSMRYVRRDHKYSLAKCSKASGISVEQLKRYESGKDQVNIYHLWNLAEAYQGYMSEILLYLTPYFMNRVHHEDDEEDQS